MFLFSFSFKNCSLHVDGESFVDGNIEESLKTICFIPEGFLLNFELLDSREFY